MPRSVASTPAIFVQWRRIVINAYHELTGSYVERDFPETMLATLYENDKDETSAVHGLVLMKQSCSIHDAMRAVDNAFRKIGAT